MELKDTFNKNAIQYDISRPTYPSIVFDIINSIKKIDESTDILEIGCGTGKATELFSETNANITCIDCGDNLLEICKKKYVDKNNISFLLCKYEDYNFSKRYDVIFSATAYHWIKQPDGNNKTIELLKDDGIFALLKNHLVKRDQGFFIESQPIYENIWVNQKNQVML
jgi:ubiquinone/menaquinone biosynthesis C-methylase UbiE